MVARREHRSLNPQRKPQYKLMKYPLSFLLLLATALLNSLVSTAHAEPAASKPGDEQPLELYIISWPDPEPVQKDTPPMRFLIDAPEPVDPAVFRREIHYFDVLNRSNNPVQ